MEQTPTQQRPVATLNKEQLTQSPCAFELKPAQDERKGELSRVLASSFLRYCGRARVLSSTESVESFIQLNHLYSELCDMAADYLAEEIPFVKENNPINELLLGFANYRLTRASRAYYFESLISRESEEALRLRDVVKDCQQDFDHFIQSV